MAGLSNERKELLARLVAEGTPISVLKREHHFDPDTVKVYHPDYRGVKTRGRTLRELDPEKWRRLELMVEDGVSVTEIARSLKMSHKTVTKYFPDAAWKHGGEEHLTAVRTSRMMREIEERGNYL